MVGAKRRGHVLPKARLLLWDQRGLLMSLRILGMAMALGPRSPLRHGAFLPPWAWSILPFPWFLFHCLRPVREAAQALSKASHLSHHRPLLQVDNILMIWLTVAPLPVSGGEVDPKAQGTKAGRKVHKDQMEG